MSNTGPFAHAFQLAHKRRPKSKKKIKNLIDSFWILRKKEARRNSKWVENADAQIARKLKLHGVTKAMLRAAGEQKKLSADLLSHLDK